MKIIDKTKPVLVTGANGYLASWLVKELLEDGITVHACVRNPDNKKKFQHLDDIASNSKGEIKYFKTDLLEDGSYEEAMKGCELVYHTASPFNLHIKDPIKELINPAKLGTRNLLNQASVTSSVKRVVVTSSLVAIATDAIDCKKAPNGILTEEIWNTTASLEHQPYCYSKTLAEKEAWEISKTQNSWDLVVINPGFVMGPVLNPNNTTSESFSFLKQFGDGTLKAGVANIGIGVVDVRDLAQAHFKAGFIPEASGRYITMGHNSSLLEMVKALAPKYGNAYPIPKKALPKWIAWLIAPFVDKAITRKIVSNNVNIKYFADNSKIKRELGMSFRPLKVTMEDAFQSLINAGVFKK